MNDEARRHFAAMGSASGAPGCWDPECDAAGTEHGHGGNLPARPMIRIPTQAELAAAFAPLAKAMAQVATLFSSIHKNPPNGAKGTEP